MSKNVSYIKDKTNNNNPIKVDMSVRDGQGKKIDETYFPIGGFDSTATVGTAEQLLLNKYVEDNEPFLYRTTGGSADVGDRMGFNSLVGGTIVFNQLVQNGNFASTSGWNTTAVSLSVSNNIATMLASAKNGNIYRNVELIVNHYYLYFIDYKGETASTSSLMFFINTSTWQGYNLFSPTTSWQTGYRIFKCTDDTNKLLQIRDTRDSGWDNIYIKNLVLFDLTLMLNGTIANYVYNLETQNAGAGVAWFRKYFTKKYYDYTTAKMLSTRPVSKTNTGSNQWDEQWVVGILDNNGALAQGSSYTRVVSSFIRVIPNQTYYRNTNIAWLYFYDENKSYISKLSTVDTTFTIPSNCAYLRFYTASSYGSTYKNDICINLSWSGTHNGEYEPYEEHEYALGSDILRGIWKLDSNNNLYFDGDKKTPDGTITRRFKIIDLSTLTWSYGGLANTFISSAISDKLLGSNSIKCSKYVKTTGSASDIADKTILAYLSANTLAIKDTNYTSSDLASFISSLNGVYLIYELATPTTETGTAYDKLEIINDWGTENAVVNAYNESTQEDDDSIALPLGHDSYYYPNASDKLGNSPDLPSDTGYYVMHYESTGREATYTLLSTWLSANGYKNETDLKDTFGLKEALGGTLRQLLSVKASIDFNNTDYRDFKIWQSLITANSSYQNVYQIETAIIKLPSNYGTKANIISTIYKTATANDISTGSVDKAIAIAPSGYIWIRDTSVASVNELKEKIVVSLLAYEKA